MRDVCTNPKDKDEGEDDNGDDNEDKDKAEDVAKDNHEDEDKAENKVRDEDDNEDEDKAVDEVEGRRKKVEECLVRVHVGSGEGHAQTTGF